MSPSQISQWLLRHEAPFTEEEKNALALFTKAYPYFVPSKYIEAASFNKEHPFAPAILNRMRLYMGDWISFHEFLQESQKKGTPVAKPEVIIADNAENEFDDDKPEYFFDTYEDEQEVIKIEEQQIFEDDFSDEEEEEMDFDFFNEKQNGEDSFATFDARKEKPKAPEIKETTATTGKENNTEEEAQPHEEPVVIVEEILNTEPEFVVDETPQPPVIQETESAMHTPEMAEEEIPQQEEPPIVQRPATLKEEPLIQPIYTEDYFLHQGIESDKTVEEEEEEDKSLMVQMSFADWLMHFKTKAQREKEEEEDQKALKTMWQKEKLAAALEEENEEIPEGVFEMAVNSIKIEEDLVSESLAEILIKQGKYDKALEMYRKLSLRNPQKNTYFADKIEKLIKDK